MASNNGTQAAEATAEPTAAPTALEQVRRRQHAAAKRATPKTHLEPGPQQAPDPEDAARRALNDARQQRVARCEAEITEALRKHGCMLDVKMLLSRQGGIEPIIQIVAQE